MATMVRSEYDRILVLLAEKEQHLAGLTSQLGGVHEEGGGWHDNSAFDQLKREVRDMTSVVVDMKVFLRDCVVVDPKPIYHVVEIGCTVTVAQPSIGPDLSRYLVAGDRRPPSLHDGLEPDPFPISTSSPMGEALMGAKIGDTRQLGNSPRSVLQVVALV